jgi:hypothetical protein
MKLKWRQAEVMSSPLESLPGRNCTCTYDVGLHFPSVTDYLHLVKFKDESRSTASDYVGGIEEYGPVIPDVTQTETHQPEVAVPQPLPPPSSRGNSTSSSKWLELVSSQQEVTDDSGKKPSDYAPWDSDESTRASSPKSGRLRILNSASCNSSNVSNHNTHSFTFSKEPGHQYQSSGRDTTTSDWEQTTLHASDKPDKSMVPYNRKIATNERNIAHSKTFLKPLSYTRAKNTITVFVQDFGIWKDIMNSGDLYKVQQPCNITPSVLIKALIICDVRQLSLTPGPDRKPTFVGANIALQLLYYCLEQFDTDSRDKTKQAAIRTVITVDDAIKVLGTRNREEVGRLARGQSPEPAESTCQSRRGFEIKIPVDVLEYILWLGPMPRSVQKWNMDAGRVDKSITPLDGVPQEPWTRGILHLLATVSSFQASIPRLREADRRAEHVRVVGERRYWDGLKRSCDRWNNKCPTTMYPTHYYDRTEKGLSIFPKIWWVLHYWCF